MTSFAAMLPPTLATTKLTRELKKLFRTIVCTVGFRENRTSTNVAMGNLPSCCVRPCPKGAVLFDPNGKLWRLPALVKVAEVMLEAPGHVVAPVNEIWRSRRIVAMHADDELLPGKTYLAVLTSRMNSRVDEVELAVIESTFRRKRNGSRKRSEVKMKSKVGTYYAAIPEDKDGSGSSHGFNPQLSSYSRRQWNPVLEPILEDN